MARDDVTVEATRARKEHRTRIKEQQRIDAEKAMSDLEKAKVTQQENTARLRSLRLAKEEADKVASVREKPKPGRK